MFSYTQATLSNDDTYKRFIHRLYVSLMVVQEGRQHVEDYNSI